MSIWMILGGLLLVVLLMPRRRSSRAERRMFKAMAHREVPMQAADAPQWMPVEWANGRKRHWISLIPRWARVLFVLVAAVLLGGGIWLWVNYQGWFITGLVTVGAVTVWSWRRGRAARRHRERVVRPFFAVMRKILPDIPDGEDARKWITIPRQLMETGEVTRRTWRERLPKSWVERYDGWGWVARMALTREKMLRRPRAVQEKVRGWKLVAWWLERQLQAEQDAEITMQVPPEAELGEGEQARLTTLVRRRVPGEWDANWDFRNFKGTFKHPPRPPSKVEFADVRDLMEALPSSQVLIALGTRNEKVVLDFDEQTPHIGLSIGTGGGKSSTLRCIISQQVRKGARVIIVDPKLISQDCFEGVPGVEIYTELEEQWAAIAEYVVEMDRRYRILKMDKTATFDRWILVMEEQNDFAEESYLLWSEIKGKKDPARPPVFGNIARSLFKGRQANMNVISVYQRLSARAAGGTEMRDQYGAKILARFSHQAWASLVGTTPRPKSSRHNGRAIVVVGGDQRKCQLVWVGEAEAREYALNGREPLTPPVYVPIAEREAEAMSMVGTEMSTPGDHLEIVHGQSMDETVSNGPSQTVTESDVHGAKVIPLVKQQGALKAIVGNDKAAEFLGYASKDAFVKARSRYKSETGEDIPGMFTVGRYPAWWPKDLKRWHAKLPGAGVKEVSNR